MSQHHEDVDSLKEMRRNTSSSETMRLTRDGRTENMPSCVSNTKGFKSLEVLNSPHPLLLSPSRQLEASRLEESPEGDINSAAKTSEADSVATQASSARQRGQ